MLSIVMPSIKGREDELGKTIEAYERLTPVPIEWVFEFGHPTCASGWNAGAERATGDVLHLGNDDLEPESGLWLFTASLVLKNGGVPVGLIREDEVGIFGRDFPRAPICMRDWWTPLPAEMHYYTDNLLGDRWRTAGHPITVADGYDFYHRKSMVGRDETPERVERDRMAYARAR